MLYFVEIYHDTGSYNGYYHLFEIDAWERYEQEIIDSVEGVDTIVIGKHDINRNRITEYKYEEDKDDIDDYLDLVGIKIRTITQRETSEVL